MEIRLRPRDTIWHAAARAHGEWPRNWRLLAALNGILDPFQYNDRDNTTPILGGERLDAKRVLRLP